MDSYMESFTFVNFIGSTATLLAIAVFLSGIKTCQEIHLKRSIENISFFPFLAIFLNCVLWIQYGYLVLDNFIIGVNIIGVIFQVIFLCIYFQFTTNWQRTWFLIVVGGGILMLIAKLMFVWYFIEDLEVKIKVCSLYCFVATVMMFGSPLVSAARDNCLILYNNLVCSKIGVDCPDSSEVHGYRHT